MKKYVSIYLKEMNYDEFDFISCEIPGCEQPIQDIHHIDARGMGGRTSMDFIENLIGLCRYHHDKYGDKKQFKSWLKEIHLLQLQKQQNYGIK